MRALNRRLIADETASCGLRRPIDASTEKHANDLAAAQFRQWIADNTIRPSRNQDQQVCLAQGIDASIGIRMRTQRIASDRIDAADANVLDP
ncbi:hypothetical protein [Burkholderia stagnalis]